MNYSPNTSSGVSPQTPYLQPVKDTTSNYTSPSSLSSTSSTSPSTPPAKLTQAHVNANRQLKRFQQDLLILTSFNENETLHWRPPWFTQESHAASFWTLYNPPNVVTELLPHAKLGKLVYTRRMRVPSDPPPTYIKTWQHWHHVCDSLGVPRDFLSEAQVELMRLGLPRNAQGELVAPPTYPLYPEPQPWGHGKYILTPHVYESHLPRKFQDLPTSSIPTEDSLIVAVHSSGHLAIETRGDFFLDESQWTHYTGHGGYRADVRYEPDMSCPKDQSWGRRWIWVPWTREMEESCRLVVRLKVRVPERKKLMLKLKVT